MIRARARRGLQRLAAMLVGLGAVLSLAPAAQAAGPLRPESLLADVAALAADDGSFDLLDELRVLRLRHVRPLAAGGSNLNWYHLGPGCDREPYGIIANYHEPGVRERVIDHLVELRARGQERLAIGLYHLGGFGGDEVGRFNGTILDSTGGVLHPQMLRNVADYLADIRAAGFGEVLFRYHPQGANDVIRSGSISDALRDENWAVIARIEPLLQQSGLMWRTDLLAEGMPRARLLLGRPIPNEPNNSSWSRYAREIWRRYYLQFGLANTVGFSFVSDTDDERIDARAEHLRYVYRVDGVVHTPPVLAFSLYGTAQRDERWIFSRLHKHLRDEGMQDVPWIISETFYNDASAARGIAEAMDATGQTVHYLTQWPLERDAACDHVSVVPPAHFDRFQRFRF